MRSEAEKFQDEHETIHSFGNKFLVECPKCNLSAQVMPDRTDDDWIWLNPKLICLNCGYNKDNKSIKKEVLGDSKAYGYARIGGNYDWYFLQPLWLQINCCGKRLWAYNEKHLDFIENYVAAKLRERTPNKNRSLSSRLPKWIKSAKNRDEILKAIGKLRKKLYARN